MFKGHDIRVKRRALGLSAERLSAILGVKKDNLYKWEKGHRPNDPDEYLRVEKWLISQEIIPHSLSQTTDKLTTSTKAPAFEMKPSNGNSDKDAVIKTLAVTTQSQQEVISKLTDLVTKLVKK